MDKGVTSTGVDWFRSLSFRFLFSFEFGMSFPSHYTFILFLIHLLPILLRTFVGVSSFSESPIILGFTPFQYFRYFKWFKIKDLMLRTEGALPLIF